MVTHDFYQKQVSELAKAVNTKLNNDLILFQKTHQLIEEQNEEEVKPSQKEEYLKEVSPLIAPAFSEPFASGTIINGYTPQGRNDIETLCKSAKQFNVTVILVMESESIEKEIQDMLKAMKHEATVIQVPKSKGIESQGQNQQIGAADALFSCFNKYFRGKHVEAFT